MSHQARSEYDYLILTPAITRPDLHARLLPAQLEFLGGARVLWIVHVDDVGNGPGVPTTARQIEALLDRASHVDLQVLRHDGPGCFYRAARRLAIEADRWLPQCRIGVLWLEDDWVPVPNDGPVRLATRTRLHLARSRDGRRILRCPGSLADKRDILAAHELQRGDCWYVSLVPRSRVSFNPGIWSRALFRDAVHRTLAQRPAELVDDPETLCADPVNAPERYARLDVFVDPRFQDAGRAWGAATGLEKWQKDPARLRQRGNVSYSTQRRFDARGVETPRDGFVLCPTPLLAGRIRLLARLHSPRGRCELKILGVPAPRFELVPATDGVFHLYAHRMHAWARTFPVKRESTTARLTTRQFSLLDTADRQDVAIMPRMRWRHAWRVPAQAILGALVYGLVLLRILWRLDAE